MKSHLSPDLPTKNSFWTDRLLLHHIQVGFSQTVIRIISNIHIWLEDRYLAEIRVINYTQRVHTTQEHCIAAGIPVCQTVILSVSFIRELCVHFQCNFLQCQSFTTTAMYLVKPSSLSLKSWFQMASWWWDNIKIIILFTEYCP